MADTPFFIRLFCEGKTTETNYFNGYFKAKGFKQPNIASKPHDHSPKGVAKAAIAKYKEAKSIGIKDEQIFIWAIFDRDGHSGITDAIKMLKGTSIGIAFSNVCFEYWILLHHEKTTRAFHDCDEIKSYIIQNYDADYEKSNDHYQRLKDKISFAIRNARQIAMGQISHDSRPDCILTDEGSINVEGLNNHNCPQSPNWNLNPYTDVHLIFESLHARQIVDISEILLQKV